MQAIDWFCGIGGLHYALLQSGLPISVCRAYDINPNATKTYSHNFKMQPIGKCIEDVKLKDIPDTQLWLMSPPCQPFTRSGGQEHSRDARSNGLSHIVTLLTEIVVKPRFLFLENVVGFEASDSCEQLIRVLRLLGYGIREFILSPLEFGIPNDRPRYYLSAAIGADSFPLINSWHSPIKPLALKFFLDIDPESVLVKWDRANDNFLTVDPESTRSGCFTKSYGKFGGSGSFLRIENAGTSKLRFFTPSEIQRLHCFPSTLVFPPEISRIQKLKLLGNSVNVLVIATLLEESFGYLVDC